MSEAAGTEATGTEAAGTETAATETAATETQGTEPAGQEATQAVDWDGKVESLPPGAQKLINDLRKADGDERVAKKTLDSILKALNPDAPDDAKPDPAVLASQLTTAQQEAADRARELAIYKAASAHGADPAKLLDSNSFMTSVKGLDPADGDAVADAIKAAVTANQSLKAARAAGASGVELSGGTGEQGQITEQQLKTMTPEQIVEAQAKGLLRNLLG
jgi:hypothetical protein